MEWPDGRQVRVLSGLVSILSGLGLVVAGVVRSDLAVITLGVGLLGAPGVVTAVSDADRRKGKDNDGGA